MLCCWGYITRVIVQVSLLKIEILQMLLLSFSIPYFYTGTSLAQRSPVLSWCLPLLLCRSVPAIPEEAKHEARHMWCAQLRHIANVYWLVKEGGKHEWYLPDYFLYFPSPPPCLRHQIFFMLLYPSLPVCFCAHQLSPYIHPLTPQLLKCCPERSPHQPEVSSIPRIIHE